MKAMRRRIALQKHFVRNTLETPHLFRGAFGVRTRPRVAFALRRFAPESGEN